MYLTRLTNVSPSGLLATSQVKAEHFPEAASMASFMVASTMGYRSTAKDVSYQ